MPPDNVDDGLRAALAIREELPDVGLLLLSQYVEDRYLGELLAAAPKVSGTCSRTGSPRSTGSSRR